MTGAAAEKPSLKGQLLGTQNESCIFARHETFHPRYGWLKKGFEAASLDPEVFTKENAPVILGVGKNMVKAIKYWCYAFKILEEYELYGTRSKSYKPTAFGDSLLNNEGWDPFLEDPASLWLLHWNLLKPPCQATAWFYTFNKFYQNIFTPDDLLDALDSEIEQHSLTAKPNKSSINKDVNCLLRMYVSSNNKKTTEDSIDCPFTELQLLTNYKEGNHFSFNVGSKINLPSHIITATCLDYISSIGHTSKTVLLSRLCYEIGSPGQVFKLSEENIYNAIEEVAEEEKNINLSETAGLVQLVISKSPNELSENLLNHYYSRVK